MSISGIVVESGITVGGGINIGGGGGYTPGVNNVIGFLEMSGGNPVSPGYNLEDQTATVNGDVGFTINNAGATGVAATSLSPSNVNWFTANFSNNQTYTCTWGPGSSVPSSPVYVGQNGVGGFLVFFIQNVNAPQTFNYPFTFSV